MLKMQLHSFALFVELDSRETDLTSKVLKGTCPDMCPETERYKREARRLLHLYEMMPAALGASVRFISFNTSIFTDNQGKGILLLALWPRCSQLAERPF